MSHNTYHPELNEKAPEKCDGTAQLSHYGKHYYIVTGLSLKGRGIEFLQTYQAKDLVPQAQHKVGQHRYKVTLAAFEKLCQQYDFTEQLLLD